MLAKRIIPCLDVKDGRVVKGINFVGLQTVGDPVECAMAYTAQGADEITFLDITATHEGRGTMVEVVRRTAQKVFVPLTVGGGIGSVDDIRSLLRAGADKVSLNSAAVRHPELITEGAEAFGSQCIVVAMDVKLAFPETADGGAFTYLRKTSGENAKHTFNFTVTVEGETLAVDCAAEITADDLTGLETAFALGSESLHFIFAKNDSQTAMDWSLEAAMTSEGQNTQLLHLAYAVQGEKQGDEIGEESVLSLSVMGMPLLAVNVEKISAPAQALPDGADQVRVAAMADEELNTWVSQTLTTALTSLATLTQKLPASVLQLMMNQE